jgi:hypothetical protein
MTVKLARPLVLLLTARMPMPTAADANTVCAPVARAMGTGIEKLPAPSAVIVPALEPSMDTVTVEFAGAVPVMVGLATLVIAPLTGVDTTGAGKVQAFAEHVAPLGQSMVVKHRTQLPLPTTHLGLEPLQSLSLRHPDMMTKELVELAPLVTAS